jgi:AcrR family transcriptional regulator
MARPAGTDSEVTRKRILTVASSLFAKKGHAGTSMRDIAGEAGVSLATVTHHFGAKNEIYRASVEAMDAQLSKLRQTVEAAISAGGSLNTIIDNASEKAVKFGRRHQAAITLMMRTVLDTGELAEHRREGIVQPYLEAGTALLGPIVGMSEQELRMALTSVTYLFIRYSLSSNEELIRVAGITSGPGKKARALQAVTDHLSAALKALLHIPPNL